jgi:hypothetical protein
MGRVGRMFPPPAVHQLDILILLIILILIPFSGSHSFQRILRSNNVPVFVRKAPTQTDKGISLIPIAMATTAIAGMILGATAVSNMFEEKDEKDKK